VLARDSTFGLKKRDEQHSGREDSVEVENENRTVVRGDDPACCLWWTMVVHLPSPDSNPVIRFMCLENILRIVLSAL
jgi:hypothetical protein